MNSSILSCPNLMLNGSRFVRVELSPMDKYRLNLGLMMMQDLFTQGGLRMSCYCPMKESSTVLESKVQPICHQNGHACIVVLAVVALCPKM